MWFVKGTKRETKTILNYKKLVKIKCEGEDKNIN